MCGRYYIDTEHEDMRTLLAEVRGEGPIATGEIFPTNTVPVLSSQGELTAMRWGFPKFDGKGEIINARSETVAAKPFFRRALKDGRCLVAASWYFEWEKRSTGKVKYALRPPGERLIWMAGLSQTDPQTGKPIFVILTREAWPGISFIHDRMPVILPPERHEAWLGGYDPQKALSCSLQELCFKQV